MKLNIAVAAVAFLLLNSYPALAEGIGFVKRTGHWKEMDRIVFDQSADLISAIKDQDGNILFGGLVQTDSNHEPFWAMQKLSEGSTKSVPVFYQGKSSLSSLNALYVSRNGTIFAGGVQFVNEAGSFLMMSADQGRTWTVADQVRVDPAGSGDMRVHQVIEDFDGYLYSLQLGSYLPGGQVLVRRSADQGRHWETIDSNPVSNIYSVGPWGSGRLFIDPRGDLITVIPSSENPKRETFLVKKSADHGNTWRIVDRVQALDNHGSAYPGTLCEGPDHTLVHITLLTGQEDAVNEIRISRDMGESWQITRTKQPDTFMPISRCLNVEGKGLWLGTASFDYAPPEGEILVTRDMKNWEISYSGLTSVVGLELSADRKTLLGFAGVWETSWIHSSPAWQILKLDFGNHDESLKAAGSQ